MTNALAPVGVSQSEPAPKLWVAAGKQLVWPTVCLSRRRGLLGETCLGGDLRGSEHVPPGHERRSSASTLSNITFRVFVSCSSCALSRRFSSSSRNSSASERGGPATRTATRLGKAKTRGGMGRRGGSGRDAVGEARSLLNQEHGVSLRGENTRNVARRRKNGGDGARPARAYGRQWDRGG